MALNDSAELLALIRRRGSIPSNSPDWPSATVLEQATRELLETHLPMLVAARGEYLVKTVDLALVANQTRYRLPARACAIRMVEYLQSDGGKTTLIESNPAEQAGRNVNQVGRPSEYTFAEHSLELYPKPGSAGDSIRVKYHQRPSRITTTDVVAIITAKDVNTPLAGQTRFTFVAPSGGGIWTAATKFDVVKATSPFDILSFDLTPVSSTATTKVFTSSALSDEIEVGDYIAPANYSPFANCPVELHQPVALRAAAAIIKAKNDGLAKALVDEAKQKEAELLIGILAPRSKGNPKIIKSSRWGVRRVL